jgi:GT2 family glycosyltransferase
MEKVCMEALDLSIVVINYNTPELTRDCTSSIKKNTKDIKYEIVLIDNSKNNRGFTGGNNLGVKKSKGKYVLLLNNDTVIHNNVMGAMVKWMEEHPDVGVSTCALKNKDGSSQTTGGYFPNLWRVFSWMVIQDIPFVNGMFKQFHPYKNENKIYELDWVTGAFLLTRHEVLENVGSLDEDYFMYTEDVDFCYRVKSAGWKVMFVPEYSITHLGGASSKREFPILSEFKGVKMFYKKHYPKWQYGLLRIILKVGAFWRIFIFGGTYVKAFKEA